ncbi:MAG: hypothetical protein AAF696_28810 [Bacteroidota bacterium]
MDAATFFILFIFVALIMRLIAGSFDNDRVKTYIQNQGGELLSKSWEPFGKGWAGEQNDRIYKVRYKDKDKNLREAWVKTSSGSGVYFSEGKILEAAEEIASFSELGRKKEEELIKLRRENQELRSMLGLDAPS